MPRLLPAHHPTHDPRSIATEHLPKESAAPYHLSETGGHCELQHFRLVDELVDQEYLRVVLPPEEQETEHEHHNAGLLLYAYCHDGHV